MLRMVPIYKNMSTPFYSWPPAIAVTQWAEGSDLEDGPAAFESDSEEIKGALDEAEKLVSRDHALAIVATFEGELRSRKGLKIVRTTEGWYMGDGYAQGGQYPALLVLKTGSPASHPAPA